MIAGVLLPGVIAAGHVQRGNIRVFLVRNIIDCCGNQPGRIEYANGIGEPLGQFGNDGMVISRDLIPDAPKDNAGMVPVPFHHASDIPVPPVPEIKVVIKRILWVIPHIECFVDHQHTQAVAGIQDGG